MAFSVSHAGAYSGFWSRSGVGDGTGRERLGGKQGGDGDRDGRTVRGSRDMAARKIDGAYSGDGRMEMGVTGPMSARVTERAGRRGRRVIRMGRR